MSDDKTRKPPGPPRSEKVQVHDIYRFVSTRLNEALLEVESLVLLGQLLHNNTEHFVDTCAIDEIEGALVRINKSRLQHEHGISPDVDNVFFLEQHPYFCPHDDDNDTSDE
jgi:hypothetical protein